MSTRRALVFSYLDKSVCLAVALLSSMILARLLTPEEIGVFSMGAVLVGMAGTLRDFGAGVYVVQEPDLTRDRLRAAFTLAIGVGIAFALLTLALSGSVAAFYDDARVRTVLLILSANFVIVPLGSIAQALMTREMQFGRLAVINIANALAQAVVGIVLAYRGLGALSLAWSGIAAVATGALMTTLLRPAGMPWMPGLREIRSVASFGIKASGGNLVSEISSGVPDLVVGRLQGLEQAGLYGRAQGFVTLFQNAIMRALWPVVLPHFSAVRRSGADFRAQYLNAVSLSTGVGWPLLLAMAVLAFPIMRVLFGAQWDAAVDPGRILCAGMAVGLAVPFVAQVMTAAGAVGELLKFQIGLLAGRFAFVALGASVSIEGAAFGVLIWGCISTVLAARRIRPHTRAGFTDLAAASWRSGVVAIAAVAPAVAVLGVYGWRPTDSLLVLAIGAPLCVIAYVVALFAFRHPLANEIRVVVSTLRALRAPHSAR